jgi:hypothetical protein
MCATPRDIERDARVPATDARKSIDLVAHQNVSCARSQVPLLDEAIVKSSNARYGAVALEKDWVL